MATRSAAMRPFRPWERPFATVRFSGRLSLTNQGLELMMGRAGDGRGTECRGVEASVIAVDIGRGWNDVSDMPPRAVENGSAGPLGSRPGGVLFSGEAR